MPFGPPVNVPSINPIWLAPFPHAQLSIMGGRGVEHGNNPGLAIREFWTFQWSVATNACDAGPGPIGPSRAPTMLSTDRTLLSRMLHIACTQIPYSQLLYTVMSVYSMQLAGHEKRHATPSKVE